MHFLKYIYNSIEYLTSIIAVDLISDCLFNIFNIFNPEFSSPNLNPNKGM